LFHYRAKMEHSFVADLGASVAVVEPLCHLLGLGLGHIPGTEYYRVVVCIPHAKAIRVAR